MRDRQTVLLNPGSCGPRRFNQAITMAMVEVIPAIQQIKDKGLKVTVAFWGHAAGEVKLAPDYYINLDEKIDSIGYA